MADYSVMVQNEEGNDDNLSLTGLVNGRQVAALVRVALLPKGKKALEAYKANAMIDAYLAMPAPKVNAGAIVVSRE